MFVDAREDLCTSVQFLSFRSVSIIETGKKEKANKRWNDLEKIVLVVTGLLDDDENYFLEEIFLFLSLPPARATNQ